MNEDKAADTGATSDNRGYYWSNRSDDNDESELLEPQATASQWSHKRQQIVVLPEP